MLTMNTVQTPSNAHLKKCSSSNVNQAFDPKIVSPIRYAVWGMAWLETPKKGAASSDMPRVSACSYRSEDP